MERALCHVCTEDLLPQWGMFTQLKSNSVGLSFSCSEQSGAEVTEDIYLTNVRCVLGAYLKFMHALTVRSHTNVFKWAPSYSFCAHLQPKHKIKYKEKQQIFAE